MFIPFRPPPNQRASDLAHFKSAYAHRCLPQLKGTLPMNRERFAFNLQPENGDITNKLAWTCVMQNKRLSKAENSSKKPWRPPITAGDAIRADEAAGAAKNML